MAIARDNSPDHPRNKDQFLGTPAERLVSASRAEEEQNFELKLRPEGRLDSPRVSVTMICFKLGSAFGRTCVTGSG